MIVWQAIFWDMFPEQLGVYWTEGEAADTCVEHAARSERDLTWTRQRCEWITDSVQGVSYQVKPLVIPDRKDPS